MDKSKVRTWYDRSEDVLGIAFKDGPTHDVVEADPDIHLELDEEGGIMGIEIWNARKSGLLQQMEEAIAEPAG
jgi:uncharacterized protein YuzE